LKTFQKPLTPGEEAEYIRLLREGTKEEAKRAKEMCWSWSDPICAPLKWFLRT